MTITYQYVSKSIERSIERVWIARSRAITSHFEIVVGAISLKHQGLFLDSVLTRKGVVTVELKKIQTLSSQVKEGIIVDGVHTIESLMIQSEFKDITIDVRLVLSNLTISFFVVDKPIGIVNNIRSFLSFENNWIFNIIEHVNEVLIINFLVSKRDIPVVGLISFRSFESKTRSFLSELVRFLNNSLLSIEADLAQGMKVRLADSIMVFSSINVALVAADVELGDLILNFMMVIF